MAKIKQLRKAPGLLFDSIEARVSVPAISWGLYEKIIELAEEKYARTLKLITSKVMRESVDKFHDLSFVDRRPFELELLVVSINGPMVTFWLTFHLYGPSYTRESFLRYLCNETLPKESGLRVENGSLIGEVLLTQEPSQVTDMRTRRVTYLLNEDPWTLSWNAAKQKIICASP